MCQVPAHDIADRFGKRFFHLPQRLDHPPDVVRFARITLAFDAIMKRPDQQRHNAKSTLPFQQILQQHDFQFDRMLGQMSDGILEQPIAVTTDKAIDIVLVGGDRAERRLEVLPGQREAFARIVRRGDDHEQRGVRAFDNFLEPPAVGDAAPGIVDVRHQRRANAPFVRDPAAWRPGQPRSARRREQGAELGADRRGIAGIAAKARRFRSGPTT